MSLVGSQWISACEAVNPVYNSKYVLCIKINSRYLLKNPACHAQPKIFNSVNPGWYLGTCAQRNTAGDSVLNLTHLKVSHLSGNTFVITHPILPRKFKICSSVFPILSNFL